MAVVPNATALQVQLGDDDARTARGLALLADTETRLAALGEISKPVHALKFLNNLEYKAVGGQQLQGNCMFCGHPVKSTGATRVVDHFIGFVLCPEQVKQPCQGFRANTDQKRKEKQHHTELVAIVVCHPFRRVMKSRHVMSCIMRYYCVLMAIQAAPSCIMYNTY